VPAADRAPGRSAGEAPRRGAAPGAESLTSLRAGAVVVALATVLFAPHASSAQPGPSTEESPAPFSLKAYGLKGHLLLKNFTHFRETPTDNRHVRNEAVLQVEWGRKLASWLDVKAIGEAREDDDRFADGVTFQIPETAPRRSVLGLKELVLTGRGGPVEVSVGKQIFAWGTADAWNPTDSMNPYDYLDPIDNEKLGVWSVAGRATAGPTTLTVVLAPFFTPSRTPIVGGRWAPRTPPGVIVDDREVPGRDVSHLQYAARLRGTVRGTDLSVSYFEGFESVPALRRDEVIVAPGIAIPRFTPVYTRMRVPGADVSTTIGKTEVHAEAVAKFVEDNGRHDRFQGIAGINHSWDEFGLRWLEQVTLILEYARETILKRTGRRDMLDPAPLNGLRDSAIGRLQFKFSEDTSLKLTGIVEFTGPPNHYAQVKLAHKVTDALHVDTGLDFFAGGRDTFYGLWQDNDRFFLMVKYYF
jgi:hypothetical protein